MLKGISGTMGQDNWQLKVCVLIPAWLPWGPAWSQAPQERRASAQQTADAGQHMQTAGPSGVCQEAEEMSM